MRKPRLTARMVDLLRGLTSFARAEADVISSGTDDQKKEADDVYEAAGWISELCAWYDSKHQKGEHK